MSEAIPRVYALPCCRNNTQVTAHMYAISGRSCRVSDLILVNVDMRHTIPLTI